MEIKWLEDFLVLATTGNFRISAEQRNVSQPAFSRRIQALEAWIGAPLIDRSSQPSQMTGAGKLFHPIAQKIVDLVVMGKEDIQAQILEEKEKMSFATLSTLSQIFLPIWLKNLQPFIKATHFIVKTEYVTIPDYFAALEENHVDFFIGYVNPKNQSLYDIPIFASLKLGEDSFVPVVSPNKDGSRPLWLPDRPKKPIPCLHTLFGDSPWPIKAHMEKTYSDLTFKSVYDSSTGLTLKEMAVEGFGLAWLPRTLVADELANGRLVRAAEKADDIRADIRIFRCLNHTEPRVEKFWNVLLEHKKI